MKVVLLFEPALIKTNIIVKDREDIVKLLANMLVENGNIFPAYCNDVLEREKEFPTGLPTEGIKVAIPHAKSENVIISGVAIGVLKEPVMFQNMANPEEKLPVRIVFLLASKTEEEQLDNLKVLMKCFADSKFLQKILESGKAEDIVEIVKSI